MKTKSLAAAFTTAWRFKNGIDRNKEKCNGVDVFINWDSVVGGKETQSCDTTLNSTTIVIPDTSLISAGYFVNGLGITDGSYIVSITDGTHAVISSAASANGTGVTLTFEQIDGGLHIELLHENAVPDGEDVITKLELYTDSEETDVYKIDTRDNAVTKDPLHLDVNVPLIAYRLVYVPNGVESGNIRYTEVFNK